MTMPFAASPLYVAVIESVPACKLAVVRTPDPLTTATVPKEVGPFLNVIVPAGLFGAADVT